MEGYDEIRIQVDRRGMAIGVTVLHNADTKYPSVRPMQPGPFDGPMDALRLALPYLTVQQTLW